MQAQQHLLNNEHQMFQIHRTSRRHITWDRMCTGQCLWVYSKSLQNYFWKILPSSLNKSPLYIIYDMTFYYNQWLNRDCLVEGTPKETIDFVRRNARCFTKGFNFSRANAKLKNSLQREVCSLAIPPNLTHNYSPFCRVTK